MVVSPLNAVTSKMEKVFRAARAGGKKEWISTQSKRGTSSCQRQVSDKIRDIDNHRLDVNSG